MCVVSNIDRADLQAAMAYHSLEFDLVVTTEDVRAPQLCPEPFEQALKLLGVSNKEAVHVGDSLSADVGGATRAGLKTVWVNRRGRRLAAGPEPWAEVEGLHQLAEMLFSNSQRPSGSGCKHSIRLLLPISPLSRVRSAPVPRRPVIVWLLSSSQRPPTGALYRDGYRNIDLYPVRAVFCT